MPGRRIAIAMSGGVDSSVAALRLVEEGAEVFGIMLRLWSAGPEIENRCCTPKDVANAKAVAANLGIPFYVLDVKEYFKSQVVDNFLDGYAKGLTPNPCITCNRKIRWGWLLERATAMGATHLATGHYAQVEDDGDTFALTRAADKSKDQSYVLHVLTQEQLSKTVLPIGGLQKSEVRAVAEKSGLPVAKRPDSQDLCFLGSMDYRDYLIQEGVPLLQPGSIIDTGGNRIGEHDGLAKYTIGQRKGIGIAAEQPFYVIHKDIENNSLIIGHRDEVGRSSFRVGHLNWISGQRPSSNDIQVQVRYKSKPVRAQLEDSLAGTIGVQIEDSLPDVTPGQWAVFYYEDTCLGGGMILP